MQKQMLEGRKPKSEYKKRAYVLEVEENGKIAKLFLEEDRICWVGFSEINRRFVRGVPKRSMKDCLRFYRHEGCDFV